MSFFDWLTGRRPGGEQPPATSSEARELEGSIFVAVDGDDMVTLMDRDTFDYQQGKVDLPDPAQHDLEELLPTITRIRALSGGMFRRKAVESGVLLDTSAAEAVAAFRRCCAIVDGPGAGHCGCLGGPTLELFAGSECVATIGVQHGHTIRWARWGHDARLQDAGALTAWLTKYGVDPTLLDLLYQNPLPFTGGQIEGSGPDALAPTEQRILLADIRYRQGNFDAALADCDALLMDHPEMAKAHAIRGDVRMHRRELEASVADYTAAISRGHVSAHILFSRAVAQDGLGKTSEAIEDCTQAIELDPSHAQAYDSRGIIRMKVGLLQEGLADFARAIELAPDWELPYVNRAGFAHMRSDLSGAVADYGRAIGIIEARNRPTDHPMLAKLYWNRSKARGAKGDKRGAEADRREAVRLDPMVG
jgi:tetratricopeptide (TPR) repeat protein